MRMFLGITALMLSTIAFAERFSGINMPTSFNSITGSNMLMGFEQLPKSGRLNDNRLAWSETYWPSDRGGIAYRWNSPNPEPFTYKLKTKAQLQKMTLKEMGHLSPAELYDIALGDYSYSLTRKTLGLFSTRDLWWEGICHGWAQAAVNYPEPAQVVVTNKDGIKVPFGSSDVKGLLAMHDAYNSIGAYARVGERCSVRGKVPGEEDSRDGELPTPTQEQLDSDKCRDTNAGSFHIVITNMIGIHSKSFVADIDRLNDVWNQPIYSYSTKVLAEENVSGYDRSLGIERKVRVLTKMTYGEELQFWTAERAQTGMTNFVQKKPVTGTSNQAYRHKNYEYILEMDASGKIVGGEWVSASRPDFLWTKRRDSKFMNSPMPLGGLSNIYRPVRR
jgi:hypothetical protein